MKRESVATGEAARRLGVAPATIQRWVDGGFLQAERTPGGHRRISLAELRRFIASTRPPELAKPLAGWLDVLFSGDAQRLKVMLQAARQRSENWAQLADEIAAVIVELGRLWEAGSCGVFEEHIASETLHRAAASCAGEISRDSNAPRVVLSTMAGERHTLGLSLAELVLAEAGWRVLWVGEGPPAEELLPLLRKLKPDLMVVAASSGMTRRATVTYEASLREAVAAERVRLILAGSAPWAPTRSARLVTSFQELNAAVQRLGRRDHRQRAT